jgi:DNA primase
LSGVWIDYQQLRARVSIRDVLERIAYEPLIMRGEQWRGACPLPIHALPIHGLGKPDKTYFSANLQRNGYQCFGCGSSGNQIDLWAALKQLTLKQAGFDLCCEFQHLDLIRYLETCNQKPAPIPTTPPATLGS